MGLYPGPFLSTTFALSKLFDPPLSFSLVSHAVHAAEEPFGRSCPGPQGQQAQGPKRVVPKSKRVVAVRGLIREVCGYAPYERRVLELVRNGLDRRALKFAHKKLGTHLRAKKKREEMQALLRKSRKRD